MPPKAKKARQEEESSNETFNDADARMSFRPEYCIHYKVKVDNITRRGIVSQPVEVKGIPWNLIAKKKATADSPSNLGVFLRYRLSDCDLWSIDVSALFTILNADKEKNAVKMMNKVFSHGIACWGVPAILPWEDLINEEKGFINEGNILIEARIALSNIVGLRAIPFMDFKDPNEPCHDLALLIEGEKVYVSKQILGIHSPVFKSMFYGRFDERDKTEIELKEIDRKEFIEMLHLIYPSDGKITDINVESLLKLADRFQINAVLDKVERFLIESKKLNVAAKLKLSDEFRLVKLQDHCLDSLKTVQDLKNLKTVDGYKELSKNIKGTLFEKMTRLT